MRLDGKAKIRILDATTGDGIEIDPTTCCNNFSDNFAKLLKGLFEGSLQFKDVDTNADGTIDIYTGVYAVFYDVSGNVVAQTPLDGTNGKAEYLTTNNSKVFRFSGEITGTGTSDVYVGNVEFISNCSTTGCDCTKITSVETSLGTTNALSMSSFAETDSVTNKKGIKVTPNQKKFGFVLTVELR